VAILMTMSRTPSVPVELKVGPFTPAEAADVGVSRNQLRGALYCRLGPGLYRWKGLVESPQLKLAAVARRLPAGAAFSGLTAAWLHGLDVIPDAPIEVTIPDSLGGGRLAGVHVRRGALIGRDIVVRRGLATTSALGTVADLGGRDPLTEGVVAADLFLHGLVSKPELAAHVAGHHGAKGIAGQVAGFRELKSSLTTCSQNSCPSPASRSRTGRRIGRPFRCAR